jgi:hypothetical protein
MDRAAPITVPLAVVFMTGAVAAFLRREWLTNRCRSAPRMSMAFSTFLLGAAIAFDPLKGYIAFGFAHALEYIVFVWAFQRRRYRAFQGPPPLLGRVLAVAPLGFYVAFFAIVGGAQLFLTRGDEILYGGDLSVFGHQAGLWLLLWTVWSSFMHFYYDGFLWKMRLPEVRAVLVTP